MTGFPCREGWSFHLDRTNHSGTVRIDAAWLDPAHKGVWKYPGNEIALRYTAAIKEKQSKLVGSSGPRAKPGYLSKGIVGQDESYVIAVNQHLLGTRFRSLNGISQIPTACEVLFAVGPQQLHLDRTTGVAIDQDHAHRPSILKSAASLVPADCFFDPDYAPVSAVLALDLVLDKFVTPDDDHQLMQEHLSALVYNPYAANPITPRWLSAQTHWSARVVSGTIEVQPF